MPKTAPRAVLEYLDPASVVLDHNVRTEGPLDPDFVASIKEVGVLEPPVAYRLGDQVRVRLGKSRTRAAIQAGRTEVPFMVYPDAAAADTAAAEIERLTHQLSENLHRTSLPAQDEARAVQDLLDLGLTPAMITRKTRIRKPRIEQASAVAGSQAAMNAAQTRPGLDLEAAAAVAEFEDDQAAVNALLKAADSGPGDVAHALQQLRDAREHARQRNAVLEQLRADGIRIADQPPAWSQTLSHLRAGDAESGTELTPKAHAGCPGHCAYPTEEYDHQQGRYEWVPATSATTPASTVTSPSGATARSTAAAHPSTRKSAAG